MDGLSEAGSWMCSIMRRAVRIFRTRRPEISFLANLSSRVTGNWAGTRLVRCCQKGGNSPILRRFFPRGELRRQLIACLRHGHNTRMSRTRGTDRRGQIPDMVSIHVRPPEIEDRLLPGHWEGDFIKGAGNQSSVGVLVERTSRLVLLAKMEDATAASALAGFSAKLNSIAAPLRQTFTYDQGKEMSRHQELTAATGVRVYFCDPHSPWQRGTCENTNGLLRQYLPKGTDLSVYTQDELDAIADSLNSRPRATHAFHSPFEVFAATLASASQPQRAKH